MKYFFAPERLVTQEFVIRSYLPGDGPALAEAVSSSYAHLSTFLPWAVAHKEATEAEQEARSFRARYLNAEDFILGIFSPDEREVLGGTGFHLRQGPLENRAAEIGMWIRASAAGRGLGTATLNAMLAWGFTEWPWERLVWECRATNRASARVAEKAGMVREGVLRGHHRHEDGTREDFWVYSLLRDEWEGREDRLH